MQHRRELNTWSSYVSERVYRRLVALDPERARVVRIALGGRKRMVGQQIGVLLGQLRAYGNLEELAALQHLIRDYNDELR